MIKILQEFGNMLFGNKESNKKNGENISLGANVSYIPDLKALKFKSGDDFVNSLNIDKRGYFLVHPANNGMPSCPFVYYNESKIFDNQKNFFEISNMNLFIEKTLELFEYCIENGHYIDPFCLFAKLDMSELEKGRLSLDLENVLTVSDVSICDNNIKEENKEDAMMYFINIYLDKFIGWNFGKYILNDPSLSQKFNHFCDYVISKKLRRFDGCGFDVYSTEYVVHYDFKEK